MTSKRSLHQHERASDLRESVARAIATSYGLDPDDIAPRSVICGPGNEHLQEWEAYEEQASAALRAVADAGFVIVPREPTEVMVDEAAKEICRQQFIDPDGVTALAGGQHRNWSLRRPVARATLRAAISEGAK